MTPDEERPRDESSAAGVRPRVGRPAATSAGACVAPDVGHVWLADITTQERVGHFRALCHILSEEERGRMSRLAFEPDRDAYMAAHVLLRCALSSCAPDVEPSAWVFARTPHGRPEVAGPNGSAGLRFNISHTRGMAACVVTPRADCGVDVERIDRRVEVEALGETVLSAPERAAVGALPAPARSEYFFRLWTLKEAYAKARGVGLSLPFDRLSVELGPPIRVHADPSVEPDAGAWQFASWTTDTHVAAAALRRSPHRSPDIVRHDTLPRALRPPSSSPENPVVG